MERPAVLFGDSRSLSLCGGSVRCFDEEKCGSVSSGAPCAPCFCSAFSVAATWKSITAFPSTPRSTTRSISTTTGAYWGAISRISTSPTSSARIPSPVPAGPPILLIDQQRAAPWFPPAAGDRLWVPLLGRLEGVAAVENRVCPPHPPVCGKAGRALQGGSLPLPHRPAESADPPGVPHSAPARNSRGRGAVFARDFAAEGLLDADAQKRMFLAVAGEYCKGGPSCQGPPPRRHRL